MDLSPTAASKAADAVTALLAGGRIRLYDRAGSELVALAFDTPAFDPAEQGLAEMRPLENARAVASGTPVRFRAFDARGREILTGTVGRTSADLNLPTDGLLAGAEVLITRLTYRQPTGA